MDILNGAIWENWDDQWIVLMFLDDKYHDRLMIDDFSHSYRFGMRLDLTVLDPLDSLLFDQIRVIVLAFR